MSNKRKKELWNEFNQLVILADFAKCQVAKENQARLARIEKELKRVGELME